MNIQFDASRILLVVGWLVASVARIIRKANGFACELFVCPADCFVTAAKFWELVMLKNFLFCHQIDSIPILKTV